MKKIKMYKWLLLMIMAFAGCNLSNEELSTDEFIENVFLLEQKAGHYGTFWQPSLNRGD
jgi:hypothetical protein